MIIYQSVYLSVYLSVYFSVYLSVSLIVCMFLCCQLLCLCLSIGQVCQLVHLPVCKFVFTSADISYDTIRAYSSVCLFVSLYDICIYIKNI